MKIVVIPTRGKVEVKEIDGTLKSLQELVGGYIEPAPIASLTARDIVPLVDEEGLLYGLEPNENLFPFFFVGTCVLVGRDREDFVSLTDEQVSFALGWLKELDE